MIIKMGTAGGIEVCGGEGREVTTMRGKEGLGDQLGKREEESFRVFLQGDYSKLDPKVVSFSRGEYLDHYQT